MLSKFCITVGIFSAGFLMLACSKAEESKAPAKIEGLSDKEVKRSKMACERYVERVCACAQTDKELQSECELAKGNPSALQLNLDLLNSEGLKISEQKVVKVAAREIAAACFQADSRLDPQRCPRKGAAPKSAGSSEASVKEKE